MVKKKATGMSKRLGFTDRQTINENKDILRYNDRLEREAQGLPPDEPRGPRGSGGRKPQRDERPSRPPRAARPVRPPALDDEQIATLTAAYQAVVGESGLEAAAEKVIERLTAHDGFERATMAGWEAASGGHAEDRSAEQWELLRTAWLGLRVALLEAYVVMKPDAQELLDRERKQQARLAKPQRPRRRPGRGPKERAPKPAKVAAPAGMPSPSAVARAARAAVPGEGAVSDPSADEVMSGTTDPVTELDDAPATAPVTGDAGGAELPAAVADPDVPTAPDGAETSETVVPDIDAPQPEPEPEPATVAAAEPETVAEPVAAAVADLPAAVADPDVPTAPNGAETSEAVVPDIDAPQAEPVAAADADPVADTASKSEDTSAEVSPDPVAEAQPDSAEASEPVAAAEVVAEEHPGHAAPATKSDDEDQLTLDF